MRRFGCRAPQGACVPSTRSVGHAPGEPVPGDVALRALDEPSDTGTRRERPCSTGWFRLTGRGLEERAGGCEKAVIGPRPGGDELGFQTEGTAYDGAVVPLKSARRRNRRPTFASPASGGEPGHPLWEADADPAALAPFPPTHPGDLLTVRDRIDYGFAPADLAVPEEEVGPLIPDGRSAFPLPTTLAGMHCSSRGNATETVSPVCPAYSNCRSTRPKGLSHYGSSRSQRYSRSSPNCLRLPSCRCGRSCGRGSCRRRAWSLCCCSR